MHTTLPPLFITGMHRSGTSLLTQIVGRLGVFTGKKRDVNYETLLLISCNEALLQLAGATWDNPVAFSRFIKTPENMQKAVQLLQEKLTTPHPYLQDFLGHEGTLQDIPITWGAKDPRLSFTLPVWQSLFPKMKLLVISREQEAVASSLTKRQHRILKHIKQYHPMRRIPMDTVFKTGEVIHTMRCMRKEGARALWQEYTEAGAARLTENPANHLAVSYEALTASPQEIIRQVAQFSGVEIEESRIEAAAVLVRGRN